MTIHLADHFTTRNGSWDVNGDLYGIDQAHKDKYGKDANQLGGATHIYVHAPVGSEVFYETADRNVHGGPFKVEADDQWENFPLYHSSAYNPDRGEVGPWNVYVNGVLIASGVGLPYGWHISSFFVVEDIADGPTPTEPPTQGMSVKDALLQAQGYINYALGQL